LWAFVESTGGTPSARRALLMIAFVWIGHVMKRPSNPLSSLIASALALLVWDPLALLSTSFQLSYAVVLAILLYGLPLNNACQRRWHPFRFLPESEWLRWQHLVFSTGKQLISFASISVSAATVSIPLGLAYFGVASPGAVVSNIVVIPFAMAAVGAGFASLVFGLLGVAILSSVFNHAAVLIISVIDRGAQWASAVPGMFFHGSFSQEWMSPAIVLVLTAVMVAFYAVGWRRVPGGLWIPPALMAGTLVLLVTPGQPDHQSSQMKSAYELAMERLQKSDPDADVKLTDEQKAQLADVTRVYEGKIAEREIFLKQRLAEARTAGNAEDFESISKQLVSERARLEEEREDAKNEIRRAGKKS
jgi:competence protein ComEC